MFFMLFRPGESMLVLLKDPAARDPPAQKLTSDHILSILNNVFQVLICKILIKSHIQTFTTSIISYLGMCVRVTWFEASNC